MASNRRVLGRTLSSEAVKRKGISGAASRLGSSPQSPSRTQVVTTSSFSEIAHQKRNAVVKILASIIRFDWLQPFKHAGEKQAVGSGFFINKSGLIVTNAHVVGDAVRLWITVPSEGERRYAAEVLGICFDSDLAVLRAKDAPVREVLEIGDSNSVRFGEEVMTLGYPLGMNSLKLTVGIISGRQGSLFQTDAPLNPGNSGGPMLSKSGKVIGINVAIVVDSQNVGFAIPSYVFRILSSELLAKNPVIVSQPTLGADFHRCSDEMMTFMDSERPGVYVVECVKGFPLHTAGIRSGDLIHVFNGYPLDNFGETEVPWSQSRASLGDLVALLTYRDTPSVQYSRKGESFTTTLHLEDPERKGRPHQPAVRHWYPSFEKIDYEVAFGLVFMNLTMNHIELLGKQDISSSVLSKLLPIAVTSVKQTKPHLILSSILTGSTMDRVTILDGGALIEEVNGTKVNDLASLRQAMLKPVQKKDGTYFFTIKSKGNEFVAMPLIDAILEDLELSSMYSFRQSTIIQQLVEKLPDQVQKEIESKSQQLAQMMEALQGLQFVGSESNIDLSQSDADLLNEIAAESSASAQSDDQINIPIASSSQQK